MQRTKGILDRLNEPVSPAPLATLRMVTGLVMLIGALRFWYLGWIETNLLNAKIQFKYTYFEWVSIPSQPWVVYGVFVIMILSSIGVLLGLFYRLSAWSLWLSFTYIELLDLTWYLNHYYFISLLLLILALLPAHRYLSLDIYFKRVSPIGNLPSWMIALPRIQMGILYVYAGIAKIQSDWLLQALPMKLWLPAHNDEPILGPLFGWTYTPIIFSWIGMLYDCTIPFWLSWRKSRIWAYLTVIVFHSLTGWLFQIGMFPVVMIGITLIFFDGKTHQLWHQYLFKFRPVQAPTYYSPNWMKKAWTYYIIVQLIVPWRFVLFPGKLFWTESGYRFGWRVMLMEKAGTATFFVHRDDLNREGIIDNTEFLLPHQEKQMAMQPDLIVQYAHWLKSYYELQGIPVSKVRAEVYVTLQGKPSKLYFPSDVNLLTKNHREHPNWLNPAP